MNKIELGKIKTSVIVIVLMICFCLSGVSALSSTNSRSTNRGTMHGSTKVGLVGNANNYRRANVATDVALQPTTLTVSGNFYIINGAKIGTPYSSKNYVKSVSAQLTYATTQEIRCTTRHTMTYDNTSYWMDTEDTYR